MFFLLPLLGEAALLLGAAVCGTVAVGATACLGLALMEDLFNELAAAEGVEQERVKARVVAHLEQRAQALRSLDVQQRRAELAQLEAYAADAALSPHKRRWVNAQLTRLRRELGA